MLYVVLDDPVKHSRIQAIHPRRINVYHADTSRRDHTSLTIQHRFVIDKIIHESEIRLEQLLMDLLLDSLF